MTVELLPRSVRPALGLSLSLYEYLVAWEFSLSSPQPQVAALVGALVLMLTLPRVERGQREAEGENNINQRKSDVKFSENAGLF